MLVLIMSVMVTPLGVLAAFYLREYARQGMFVSAVRIAVNNLAGVPSIVFGVFGVGFFIYVVGGTIDRVFFSEALPSPTFGSGGPGGAAHDHGRGEARPGLADRRLLAVRAPRPEVHAPGLPHLRRWLPVAERRCSASDGIRHDAPAAGDRRAAEPVCGPAAQPPAPDVRYVGGVTVVRAVARPGAGPPRARRALTRRRVCPPRARSSQA